MGKEAQLLFNESGIKIANIECRRILEFTLDFFTRNLERPLQRPGYSFHQRIGQVLLAELEDLPENRFEFFQDSIARFLLAQLFELRIDIAEESEIAIDLLGNRFF